MEHKFVGEVAYAILCPHCDESILCKLTDEKSEEKASIIAHIYVSREDAQVAVKNLIEENPGIGDPKIIMVNISPISIQMSGEVKEKND